mgnify:CR=1 FL=1
MLVSGKKIDSLHACFPTLGSLAHRLLIRLPVKEMSMMKAVKVKNVRVALKVSSGIKEGTMFPIKKRRNIIGRREGASIPVEDARVSRDHAAVDYDRGAFYIVDLGSKNGTYLNNKRLQRASKINIGDQIRIGSSIFKVELLQGGKSSEKSANAWKSETRVISLKDVRKKEKGSLSKKWKVLLPPEDLSQFINDRTKIAGLLIGTMLIFFALLMQLNAFSGL